MKLTNYLLVAVAFSFSAPLHATVLFSDDFNDGNTDGWSFYRTDATEWGVLDSKLNSSTGSNDTHDAVPGFAIINGIETPDHFKLEADISVVHNNLYQDWGHVGFVWGAQDPASTTDPYNTTYLRTHQDRTTSWDTTPSGGYSGGELLMPVGSVTNGVEYHLTLEVDYVNQIMTTTFLNGSTLYSATFSGSQFSQTSNWSGGSIGLIQWGEEVTFDNVVLTNMAVPEPSIIALMVAGLAGIGFTRRRKLQS